MKRARKPAHAVAPQRSVVVGTTVDQEGFVTVTVTNARGKIRYRVPARPIEVPVAAHRPVAAGAA